MNQLLTKLIAVMVFALAVMPMHADDQVIINGEKVSGKSIKQIKFDCEKVIVVYTDGTEDDDISTANIKLITTSGVRDMRVFDFAADVNAGQIEVKGLDATHSIDLYDLGGRVVRRISAPSGDAATIAVEGLAPGVYVLRNGSNVVKLTIK